MQAKPARTTHPDLIRASARFAAWRNQRKIGLRIPHELWNLAVSLANAHGVSPTATALRIDYYDLKRRVAAQSSRPTSTSAHFVEWPSPVVATKQCHFEFQNRDGATLKGQLLGYDRDDLEALMRGFWGA